MGKQSRSASRRNRKQRRQQPPQRRSYRWFWTGLVFGVLATAVAAGIKTFPGQGPVVESREPVATTSKRLAKTGSEPSERHAPFPEIVIAYDKTSGKWREQPFKDLENGQEFQCDGKLCYVDSRGLLRSNPKVRAETLAWTDRPKEREARRFPEATETVRFVDDDFAHIRFDRMGTLRPGSQFLFQGKLYRGVADPSIPSGVSIAETDIQLSRVTKTFKSKAKILVDLTLADDAGKKSVITGTPEHPFFVPDQDAYIPMGDLSSGMRLETLDASIATVVSLDIRHEPTDVYNFEVEGTHNYHISAGEDGPAVLVHNVCELDFVPLKRARQLADDPDNNRVFKLTPDELDFVRQVRERKPNLQILRTNQKAQLGDFLIVDRSNHDFAFGFVVDLKKGGGSAGNQLQNASTVPDIKALRVRDVDTASGTADELLELLSRGRAAFPQE